MNTQQAPQGDIPSLAPRGPRRRAQIKMLCSHIAGIGDADPMTRSQTLHAILGPSTGSRDLVPYLATEERIRCGHILHWLRPKRPVLWLLEAIARVPLDNRSPEELLFLGHLLQAICDLMRSDSRAQLRHRRQVEEMIVNLDKAELRARIHEVCNQLWDDWRARYNNGGANEVLFDVLRHIGSDVSHQEIRYWAGDMLLRICEKLESTPKLVDRLVAAIKGVEPSKRSSAEVIGLVMIIIHHLEKEDSPFSAEQRVELAHSARMLISSKPKDASIRRLQRQVEPILIEVQP